MLDINKIRKDFPILDQKVNGQKLIYFDNAATSQTPNQVVNSIVDYYQRTNSNIHRGNHKLSIQATTAYEDVRKKLQKYFNSRLPQEIIFTSGTTQSINIITLGYTDILTSNDEVIVSKLQKEGINHARRTVAKYRELMCIPSSAERRKIMKIQNIGI